MASDLVSNFLQAFTNAHQLQMQQQQLEQEQIRNSVQDAIRQQTADEQANWHKQELDRYNQDRQVRQAQEAANEKKNADVATHQQAQEDAAQGRIRNTALGNSRQFQAQGVPKKTAMLSAGLTDQEINPILQSDMQSQNALIGQTNAGIPARNQGREAFTQEAPQTLAAFLGPFGQHLGQALASQVVPPQEQAQPQLTMADVENQQSPEFLRKQENTESLVDRRGTQANLDVAKTEHLLKMEGFQQDLDKAHTELATAMAHRAVTQTGLIPKEFANKMAYQNGMLDVARQNAWANKLRAVSTEKNQAGVDARAEANRASIFLNMQAQQIKPEYDKAKTAESKAAEMNLMNGNYIKAQQPIVGLLHQQALANPTDLKVQTNYMKAQADLAQHQALWDANNTPLPQPDGSVKSRIQMLTEDKLHWENEYQNSLKAAGNMDAIYKKKVGADGQVSTLPTANIKAVPTPSTSSITKQFMNNKTGKMETFTLKNGQWVR